jgi:hypothetical protein
MLTANGITFQVTISLNALKILTEHFSFSYLLFYFDIRLPLFHFLFFILNIAMNIFIHSLEITG